LARMKVGGPTPTLAGDLAVRLGRDMKVTERIAFSP